MMIYPHSTGRNLEELLRVLDSLLLTEQEESRIATPSNWKPGQDVLVGYNVDDEEAKQEFGKEHVRVVQVPSEQGQNGFKKHYMRYTCAPKATRGRRHPDKKQTDKDDDACRIS